MKTAELDVLHDRIASALGLPVADVRSFSLAALQEWVRGNAKDPKLYGVIADIRALGLHMTVSDPVETRRARR